MWYHFNYARSVRSKYELVKDETKNANKRRTRRASLHLVAEMLGGKIQTVLKKAMSATYRTRHFVSIVIAMGMVHTEN